MKRLPGALLVVALAVICTGAVAEEFFPSVSLQSFNPTTFEYVYRVDTPSNLTYDFGQLWVKGEMKSEAPFEWTFGAAGPSPVDAWITSIEPWATGKDAAKWISDLNPVSANTAWSGTFSITVPNSQPGAGYAVTANGDPEAYKEHEVEVMAPAVIPEPSAILSLGLLAGGLIPLVRRRMN